MNSDLPDEEKQKILNKFSNTDFDGSLGINSGRYLKGHGPLAKGYPSPEYIDNAINAYHQKQAEAKAALEAEREAVKKHGTADEVMKFRETFTTEEWQDIARRLEAEEKVKKYLSKPVQPIPTVQNEPTKSVSPSDKKAMTGLNSDERKIFLTGDARDVYSNRTKFSPEQLDAINRRLRAEDEIGKYAKNQVDLDGRLYRKFKTAVKWIDTAGKGAQGLYNIAKLIDPSIAANGNGNNNNQNLDKILKSIGGIAKKVDTLSGMVDSGSKKGNKSSGNTQNSAKGTSYNVGNVKPNAMYVIKFEGSNHEQRVKGSKLNKILNSTDKSVETVYEEKKK